MSEETTNTPQDAPTSAETEKPDTAQPMIPKSRLDDVIAQRDEAREQLKVMQKQLKSLEKAAGDKESLEGKLAEMQQQLADAQAANERRELEGNVIAAAASQRFRDPKDALRLLDVTRLAPDGIDEALSALVERKPYLVEQATNNSPTAPKISANNPAPRGPLTKDTLKQMTPAQINALFDEGALDDVLGKAK